MSDERDSLVGGDCDPDDLLELRSYDRSAESRSTRLPAVTRRCQRVAEAVNILHGTTTRKEKSFPKLAVR